ncbi:MAG: protein kinase [Proteobacteria bacterium]|nr:protein kinase [Pseudomonadota bacterium]
MSPLSPSLAQLDSQGSIHINITIPASALWLGRFLGEGSYGLVYQGVWNDQLVAIKRLKAQYLTEKAIEELRREAQIMFQWGATCSDKRIEHGNPTTGVSVGAAGGFKVYGVADGLLRTRGSVTRAIAGDVGETTVACDGFYVFSH